MTIENELEILPDYPTDISGRLITTENLKRFKGLEGQMVFNKDESYRPYVMDAENFGGRPLMFLDEDLPDDGHFSVTQVTSKNAVNDDITLDVNDTANIQLNAIAKNINLHFNDLNTIRTDFCKKLRIYVKFVTGSNKILFPDNFFWSRRISNDQLTAAQALSKNKAGDMAIFECDTLDSGALWFGRLVAYWSK